MPSVDAIVTQGRRLVATTLLDEGLIADQVFVDNDLGAEETFVARTSTIPCRVVQPRDPPLEGRDGIMQQAGLKILNVEVGTDIGEKCRITVNGDRTYMIVGQLVTNSVTAVVDRYHIREV